MTPEDIRAAFREVTRRPLFAPSPHDIRAAFAEAGTRLFSPSRVVKDLPHAIVKQSGERRIVVVASQRIVDRYGDVVEPRGIDTTNFYRSGAPFLQDHDSRQPLGRVLRTWIEPRSEGEAFMAEVQLVPAGVSPRVDEAWLMIVHGVRAAVSIGFTVLASDTKRVLPGMTGTHYTKIDLVEVSSTPTPACASCVIEQKACCTHGTTTAEQIRLAFRDAMRRW